MATIQDNPGRPEAECHHSGFYWSKDNGDGGGLINQNSIVNTTVTRTLALTTRICRLFVHWQFDMLLGSLQMDGTRRPGAIDKFRQDTQSIVEVVAEDSETKGHFEDAIKLYDLAQVLSLQYTFSGFIFFVYCLLALRRRRRFHIDTVGPLRGSSSPFLALGAGEG